MFIVVGTHVQSPIFCEESTGHDFEPIRHHPGPPGELRGQQPHAYLQGLHQIIIFSVAHVIRVESVTEHDYGTL